MNFPLHWLVNFTRRDHCSPLRPLCSHPPSTVMQQRRSHRVLHSEDDIVAVHTPSKRLAVLEHADADAVPPPPSARANRRAAASAAASAAAVAQPSQSQSQPRRRSSRLVRHSDSEGDSDNEREEAEAEEEEGDSAVDAAAAVTPTVRRRASPSSVAAAASPSTAASSSTAVAAPSAGAQAASQSASPSKAEVEAAVRDSKSFLLIRSLLLLVIFAVLFTLTQWYMLEPLFHPHRTEAYKQAQREKMRQQILQNICPPGESCNYDLDDKF